MISPQDITPFLSTTIHDTDFSRLGSKEKGKVRDVYVQEGANQRVLITTDRQSAFNYSFCDIPLKGQVLNQVSAWWFEQVSDIMQTHVLDVPDPNVMVVKSLSMLPVEIIVRAYLTGSSSTAIWTHYNSGVRMYCGHALPDGMVKNQPLPEVIVTPTTKTHDDQPISRDEILEQKLIAPDVWEEVERKALQIFARGQKLAAERGLILVDTKYEIGLDADGVLTIGDEVHTPDSSRYWIADSYEEAFAAGKEPPSLDKEFFRLWLRGQGYKDGGAMPEITDDVRLMLSQKYIELYERMTGSAFEVPSTADVLGCMEANLKPYMSPA